MATSSVGAPAGVLGPPFAAAHAVNLVLGCFSLCYVPHARVAPNTSTVVACEVADRPLAVDAQLFAASGFVLVSRAGGKKIGFRSTNLARHLVASGKVRGGLLRIGLARVSIAKLALFLPRPSLLTGHRVGGCSVCASWARRCVVASGKKRYEIVAHFYFSAAGSLFAFAPLRVSEKARRVVYRRAAHLGGTLVLDSRPNSRPRCRAWAMCS